MGNMNPAIARARLQAADLDALLLLSPRHFTYATGHSSWFLNLYGQPGFGAAILPANAEQPSAAMISDVEEGPFRAVAPDFPEVATYPVWIAYADVPPMQTGDAFGHLAAHSRGQPAVRAGQVDVVAALDTLIGLLRRLGLAHARIGIEEDFAAGRALEHLKSSLPACRFVDATRLLEELRAVKSPQEAALLHAGTQLAEAAIEDVIAAIRPGMTAGEIARRYRAGVFAHAEDAEFAGSVTSARITLRVGPHVLHPQSAGSYAVQPGDLVFMDCGVEVAGYWADMGRCFVLGKATPVQRQIYGALRAGFDAAVELLTTGNTPRQVFEAGLQAVHGAGLASYVRGNLGHGIGLDRAPELPIISREEPLTLAPGHVISVEFPYYVHGIGALQIEDTFHLTDHGRRLFNRLSRELVEIG